MDLTAVDAYIAEAQAAALALADPIEGLQDRVRLHELHPATLAAVQAQIPVYDHRLALVHAVEDKATALRESILALLDDGHPIEPALPVSAEVLADLAAQDRTQKAADRAFILLKPAVHANVTFTEPQDLPPITPLQRGRSQKE